MMNLEFSGRTPYGYSGEPTAKLAIEVEIAGVRVSAIVDTAAPYMICEPEIAEQLSFTASESIGATQLRTHLGLVTGHLYRAPIILPAASGASVELQATVFVPEGDKWDDNPSFLGFHGCLERIRVAIDPGTESFYFGPFTTAP
jgi:hypothetical protein